MALRMPPPENAKPSPVGQVDPGGTPPANPEPAAVKPSVEEAAKPAPAGPAAMPPKEQIFAKLLYLINAPAQQLVTALGAVGRNLAVVIDQGVKENKFQA